MSDDVLIINTESPISTKPIRLSTEPLSVFDDRCPTLREVMPEFHVQEIRTPQAQNFIDRLKRTMVIYDGIGLSANQCGYRLRMFAMGDKQTQIICINPRIVDKGDNNFKMREGCLSYPGLFLNVERYDTIEVSYYNENGEEVITWLNGLPAQVFQHEFDHMNGIVFTEHVKSLALKMAKEKQFKLLKKIKRMR